MIDPKKYYKVDQYGELFDSSDSEGEKKLQQLRGKNSAPSRYDPIRLPPFNAEKPSDRKKLTILGPFPKQVKSGVKEFDDSEDDRDVNEIAKEAYEKEKAGNENFNKLMDRYWNNRAEKHQKLPKRKDCIRRGNTSDPDWRELVKRLPCGDIMR